MSALNTCIKLLREGDERAKALLLLALLDIYQSKLMRVSIKEPVELEPMKKIDEIRRFSNKELRLTKESKEQLQELDCLKDLDLFETMCKILNIPMEVKKIWARRRLMPWFRANMTAWLYEYAKKHMSKHSRAYSAYQLDIGAGAFKLAFVTHRNTVTTAVKRISRTSECDGR